MSSQAPNAPTLTPTLNPATPTAHHRFHFLDALRGMAAMFVVFWHVPPELGLRGNATSWLAVDFFFCLSGFVVGFSYERRLQTTLSLKNFAAARIIRLYPMYLFTLVIGLAGFLAFDLHSNAPAHLFARLTALLTLQLLMLPHLGVGWAPILFPLNMPAWSLFFEFIANFAYAGLVRKGLASTRNILALGLLSALPLALFLLHHPTMNGGVGNSATAILGLFRVGVAFLAGVIAMRVFRRTSTVLWPARLTVPTCLLLIATLALLLLTPFALMRTRPFSLLTVTLLFPCLIYFASRCKVPASWTGVCVFLGNISYPLYLLHVPLLNCLHFPPVARFAALHAVLFTLTLIGACVLIAHVALKIYDQPVRSYLTRRYRGATAAVQPSFRTPLRSTQLSLPEA